MKPNRSKWILAGIVLVVVFLSPFILVQLNISQGWGEKELWKFGLKLEAFYKIWVAIWGVSVTVATLILNYLRLNKQGEQIKNQDAQIAIQDKAERNNRLKNGIELLSNKDDNVVIGAIYVLDALANECPQEYAHKVFDILNAFIRTKSSHREFERKEGDVIFPEVFQLIINLLFHWKDISETPYKHYVTNEPYTANFRRANLQNANFNSCQLQGARFYKARLYGTTFIKANLRDSFWAGSQSYGVNFSGALMGGANFSDVSYLSDENVKTSFFGSAFVGTKMRGVNLQNTQFQGCVFNNTVLQASVFRNTVFSMSDVTNTDCRGALMFKVNVRNTFFKDVDIRGVQIHSDEDKNKKPNIKEQLIKHIGKETPKIDDVFIENEYTLGELVDVVDNIEKSLKKIGVAKRTIGWIKDRTLPQLFFKDKGFIKGQYTKEEAQLMIKEMEAL